MGIWKWNPVLRLNTEAGLVDGNMKMNAQTSGKLGSGLQLEGFKDYELRLLTS